MTPRTLAILPATVVKLALGVALGCSVLAIPFSSASEAEEGDQLFVANAGPDREIIAWERNGTAHVQLDGSGSRGAITSSEWREGDRPIAIGIRPTVELPVGRHMIFLEVSDDDDRRDTDEVNIRVVPPEVELPDGFEETLVTRGLTNVISMAFSPDGRLFVAERLGALRIIKEGVLLPRPFLTVPVINVESRGLLGVEIDPHFEKNGYVYVYYTVLSHGKVIHRLSRFTTSVTDPDISDPVSELVLLSDIPTASMHNGGAIHFGPDGKLYVTTGEADGKLAPQELETLHGKLLRIDPARYPKLIPQDNPFVKIPDARGEIWAYGFRNPFTFAIDPATGTIHVNDVGGDAWEEVNRMVKGGNYGWPVCEGPCDGSLFEDPLYAYDHEEGCAVTGGSFYRGAQFPREYDGSYFFTDWCMKWIKRLTPEGTVVEFSRYDRAPMIVDLDVGPDGSLYSLVHGLHQAQSMGMVRRIRFVGSENHTPLAVVSVDPTSGPAPLRVEFSAEGSQDADGDTLSYRWDFGEGAAVKDGAMVSHTYDTDGPHQVRLTVADSSGQTDTATVTVLVGNRPTGRILTPVEGATFRAGESVPFEGEATDAEDGSLAASAFQWTIVLQHHAEGDPHHHTHPFRSPQHGAKKGAFLIPKEVHDHEIWFRIHLTVTDSAGLTHVATRNITLETTTLQLETSPPGLKISLDDKPIQKTPMSKKSIVGSIRTIEAPLGHVVDGVRYRFGSWSDGGAARHVIKTTESDTTYTATYIVDAKMAEIIGHWNFDNMHSRRPLDLSGNRIQTFLIGEPMETAGRFGSGLSFDGIDDFVDVGNYSQPVFRYGTIALWVKSPEAPSDQPASGPMQGKKHAINWNHPDSKFRGAATIELGRKWYAASFGELRAETWYHLAATFDETALRVYKDGILTATTVFSERNTNKKRGYQMMNFGRHRLLPQYFRGTIDEVRIYKGALREEEVLELAQGLGH